HQEKRQAADFIRLPDAWNRLRGLELLEMSFVLPEVLAEIGLDQPRGNGVHAYIMPTEFHGPHARHHDQAGFGEAVYEPFPLRPDSGDRGNVENDAASAPDHAGNREPDQPHGRQYVD